MKTKEKSNEKNDSTNELIDVNCPEAVSATAELTVTVTLFERYGRAFIAWSIDRKFPIGARPQDNFIDVVQLREGATFIANFHVNSHTGEVDTGRGWGSGLNAAYIGWDSVEKNWVIVCKTPDTKQ